MHHVYSSYIAPGKKKKTSIPPVLSPRPRGCDYKIIWMKWMLVNVSVAERVDKEGKKVLVVYMPGNKYLPGRRRSDRRIMTPDDAKMVLELVKVRPVIFLALPLVTQLRRGTRNLRRRISLWPQEVLVWTTRSSLVLKHTDRRFRRRYVAFNTIIDCFSRGFASNATSTGAGAPKP